MQHFNGCQVLYWNFWGYVWKGRNRAMRVLYFTQFYSPENIAAAFRAADHSRIWVRDGNDVSVFTGWPNYPTGRLFDGYQMVPLGEENIDGVRVFRSASKIQPNISFTKRIESGISFIANGIRNLGRRSPVGSNYDVVLVTCGTVFAAWLGVHYAKKHHLPLVVEFRDITYKQMLATGSKGAKVAAMKSLELSFCKAADRIVVLTDGFKKDFVAEGFSAENIFVVPNGADVVPCEHSWEGPLRLGYFGTMGLSQDVPSTVGYAKRLFELGLISTYELVGEGAARAELEKVVATEGYDFLTLEHGVPMAELESHYAHVHMTVVSLQKAPEFAGTIPSKIFQSFARGVPVLFFGPEGDASDLIRRSNAGVVFCGSPKEDLCKLKAFASRADLSEELARMSESAVSFMEKTFSRKLMAEKMIRILFDAANLTQETDERTRNNG
jgi:hypothetical protein